MILHLIHFTNVENRTYNYTVILDHIDSKELSNNSVT